MNCFYAGLVFLSLSHVGMSCIWCTNTIPDYWIEDGKDCDTYDCLKNLCNQNDGWVENKYCQLNCYEDGHGYEGDECCQTEGLVSPSSSPSVSMVPTDHCITCTSEDPPTWHYFDKDCSDPLFPLSSMCVNDDWQTNKYCQVNCYEAGHGYEGDFCCTSDGTAPVETPVASPVKNPVASPVETPVASPVETPVASPVKNPVASPVKNPMASPVKNPVASPVETPVASPVTIPVASPSASSDFIEMLEAVNEERSKEGLGALCYNEKLIEAAQIHSDDMANGEFMSHTGSDGSSPDQRMSNAGFNWSSAAENVAMGQLTVAEVMISWMNSPGHRANILGPSSEYFGLGLTFSSNNVPSWTQVFGNSNSESCTTVTTPVTSPVSLPVTSSPTSSPTVPVASPVTDPETSSPVDCTQCTNISRVNRREEVDCSNVDLLETKCNNRSKWIRKTLCQQSCWDEVGISYDGKPCCATTV